MVVLQVTVVVILVAQVVIVEVEVIKFLHQLKRRIICGMANRDILIYGFRSDKSAFWREKEIQDRIDYAFKNPCVFKYNFGHLELIERRIKRVV